MKYYATIGDREREFTFEREGDALLAKVGDRSYRLDLSMVGDGTAFSLLVDDRSYDLILIVDASVGHTLVQVNGELVKVRVEDERERTASEVAGARADGKRTLTASMPGVVADVLVAVGDQVEDGQTLLILEAMKMQNPIQAEGSGMVRRIHVGKGDTIATGANLVELQ